MIRFPSDRGWWPVELEVRASAERERAGPRIREVIDTTGSQTGGDEHFRIVSLVARDQQQVVTRGEDASRAATRETGWHLVADRDVLKPHERTILDPPIRELRGLGDRVRVRQRVCQEITT